MGAAITTGTWLRSDFAVYGCDQEADDRWDDEHDEAVLRLVVGTVKATHNADNQIASTAEQRQENKTHDDLASLEIIEGLVRYSIGRVQVNVRECTRFKGVKF